MTQLVHLLTVQVLVHFLDDLVVRRCTELATSLHTERVVPLGTVLFGNVTYKFVVASSSG